MSTPKPRKPSEYQPNANSPYCGFTNDQDRLAALKHLERHRTIRQLVIAASTAISGFLSATVVYLLKSGWPGWLIQ